MLVLAQQAAGAVAESVDIPRWAQSLVQLGVSGAVIAWLAFKLIPKMNEQSDKALDAFRAEAKEQRDHCEAEARAQRAHCTSEASSERASHEVHVAEIHGRLDKLVDVVRDGKGCRAAERV